MLLNTAQFGIFLLLFTAHFVFGLLFSAQFQNCCYLRHNSEKSPVVIHDTVSAWIVILGTVVVGCKRGHNLWWLCAEFQRLLFTTQFGIFVGGLLCCAQLPSCIVSFDTVCPVVRHGTLFFRAQLCGYARHKTLVMPDTIRLLSTAQFILFSKIIKALRE